MNILGGNNNSSSSTNSNEESQLKGLGRASSIFDFSFEKYANTLKTNLTNIKSITESTSKLEELTFKLTTESLGQTRVIGEDIRNTIAQAAFESAQYGVTLDDQLNVFIDINSVMQKNTLLTNEQSTNIALLARNAGVATSEIATMVEAFDTIGVNTDTAIENISNMQQQARSYGLNVGQFMKSIGSNIKLLNSYNFKNGVDGFTKMVAKAQALRIDFNKTVSLADDLLSPEKAIETAAGFQMLGGAVGDLGDPFKLLYMAQNDVEGLQDSILDMAESAVSFNEKTGEFDIPVTEMYRLREAAKLTGQDYQELANTAVKSAERTRKLDMLSGVGLDDDTKELVANLGELQDGTVKIKVPGFDEMVDARLLGDEKYEGALDKLQEIQEDSKKSDKEIALEQLSAAEKTNEILMNQAAALGPYIGTSTDAITSMIDIMGAGAETTAGSLGDVFNDENTSRLGSTLTDAVVAGFQDDEANAKLRSSIGNIFNAIDGEISEFTTNVQTNFADSNVFKDSGDLLNLVGTALQGLGISLNDFSANGGINILEGLSSTIAGASNELLGLDQRTGQNSGQRPNNNVTTQPPGNADGGIVTGPATVYVGEYMNAKTNPEIIAPLDKLQDLINKNMGESSQSIGGEVSLNVGGKIDLTVDGRNLPNNISSEQLANEVVSNPDFTSKLMSIFTNSKNTYSE